LRQGETAQAVQRQYRASILLVGVMLAISWLIKVGGRWLAAADMITPLTRDLASAIALVTLCVGCSSVIARARTHGYVRLLLIFGVVFLVLFQLSDVFDEIEALAHLPLFAKLHPTHIFVEHLIFVTGALCFALAFSLALLDGDAALRKYEEEHGLLLENIAERERAERALRDIRDALEVDVRARTTELADRNRQLQAELAERTRFEEVLARRLRYEEGLAACSHVLLADAEPTEALKRALSHLQHATQACRIYIFENVYIPELGPCAMLTHEVWDTTRCPWCRESPGLQISYNDGLHRWREGLAHGEPITGTISRVSPPEREFYNRFGAKSILLLPVGWEGRWRGFIGFDDTTVEREWSPEEVRMLRTAAEMVGACKERLRAEEALRKAYMELERRVDDRTTDLTRANEQLNKEVADRRRAEQEKRKLESQLRQAQKMQAIGTLAGGIAHDFNNILASIIGYTELGLRKMDTDGPLGKYFGEVLKAANRARELVRQILIFSRQSDHERAPVFLHLIAQEVIALMHASCPANIKIEAEIDSDTGAVLGDPVQMHQVVLNLCTNAQHAMKRCGGVLSLHVGNLEIEEEVHTSNGHLRPGSYVLLTVSDTGHGMDPALLDRIFEPFFTTKSVNEGTGMGLAIVHGIVTGQGGAITVQSVPENGSIFHVYLPLYDGPLPQVNVPRNEALNGTERIMVVDDEPQLVTLWTELLTQYGYEVTGFSNSLHALASFRDDPEHYDLVLLDQTMPAMTGAELAENMLKVRPGLPIIMATGFSEAITPETAKRIGISEFVYKPILGNDLASAVRKAIDRATVPLA